MSPEFALGTGGLSVATEGTVRGMHMGRNPILYGHAWPLWHSTVEAQCAPVNTASAIHNAVSKMARTNDTTPGFKTDTVV